MGRIAELDRWGTSVMNWKSTSLQCLCAGGLTASLGMSSEEGPRGGHEVTRVRPWWWDSLVTIGRTSSLVACKRHSQKAIVCKPGWETSPGPDPGSRTPGSFLLFKFLVRTASVEEGKRGKEVGRERIGKGKEERGGRGPTVTVTHK